MLENLKTLFYSKYSDTLSPEHIVLVLKCEQVNFTASWYVWKTAEQVVNSLDSDQIPFSATSDLDLHYLLKPVCLNT